jgi:hypothetical protein
MFIPILLNSKNLSDYVGISKNSRTETITNYMLIFLSLLTVGVVTFKVILFPCLCNGPSVCVTSGITAGTHIFNRMKSDRRFFMNFRDILETTFLGAILSSESSRIHKGSNQERKEDGGPQPLLSAAKSCCTDKALCARTLPR